MENSASKLWQLYTQQPKLWEGWDHADTPIAFHDSEKAVLLGHPNPSQEFLEKEREGVKYYVANPKPVSFTANSAVDLNGIPTATVMWQERDEEEMLGLITHEAFHAFQLAKSCPWGNILVVMKYPVNDPLVQALAEIEASLLCQAVSGEMGEEVIRGALDARAARQARLPEDVAAFENETELGEGLATYVEIKTAGSGSHLWQSKLNTLAKLNKNAWGADRLRFYYSGMAWALLCDRYAPGWQRGAWGTLADIVAEAVGHVPNPERPQYTSLDFAEFFARQEREAGEREKAMKKSLAQAMPGKGVRVEIITTGNPVGGGWNPNTTVTYPGAGRFHPTCLMYIFDTGAELKIETNALEKESCRHIIFERSDLNILLNGNSIRQGEGLGTLKISGADCNVYIPRARINFDGAILIAQELTKAK
ncbi:MAG: hypothetical protein PHW26_06450 [Eubacteriales bacterium]|nr:hypothetical protein [Eubacteriales bacterium]